MLETHNEQTLARLRALCLALPETSETTSWNHPNFKAGKKTFVAFERVNGRASIAFRLPQGEVERLLQRKQFFETPYGRGLWASLWADDAIDWRRVQDLVAAGTGSCRAELSGGGAETDGSRARVRSKGKGQKPRSKGKSEGGGQRYRPKVEVKGTGQGGADRFFLCES